MRQLPSAVRRPEEERIVSGARSVRAAWPATATRPPRASAPPHVSKLTHDSCCRGLPELTEFVSSFHGRGFPILIHLHAASLLTPSPPLSLRTRHARRISTLTVLARRPIASPLSRGVLPSHSITATCRRPAPRRAEPAAGRTEPCACPLPGPALHAFGCQPFGGADAKHRHANPACARE